MKQITLSPRLEKIAELIENAKNAADIGTDHAYLPVALIQRGKAETAIASDIRPGPLKHAEDTVRKYGMADKVSLRLGPGLETVTLKDGVDVIIIAGMGGETIAAILENSVDIVKNAKTIIAQPMTSAPELREYIYDKGFADIQETLAVEGEKIYNIISMKPGCENHPPLKPYELIAGRDLIERKPEHFDRYIKNIIKARTAKLEGLKHSSSPDRAEIERTEEIIEALRNA